MEAKNLWTEIDAGGCVAIPGLTDIHFHGCMGQDFCDGTREAIDTMAAYEASVGVTKLHGALFLRRDGKQLYTIAGRFVQSVEHGDVRFVDIFAVLSPLLRKRYKRAFHVDPMEMRSVIMTRLSELLRRAPAI